MTRNRLRLFLRVVFLGPTLAIVALVAACNLWIVLSTQGRIYDSTEKLDHRPMGLVLGTSRKVDPTTLNRHFENRLAAAAELYRAGLVDKLIVSGHRESVYYDEPRDMAKALVDLSIPEAGISQDGLGGRTMDSVRRASEVFGYDRFVIISDDFHVARALFLADCLGLDVVAYRSTPVDFESSWGVRVREWFARVKAVLDVVESKLGSAS